MKLFVFAMALLIVLSMAVGAAEPAKISINVKDLTVTEVGKFLAEQSGLSFIVDPKINKKITLGLNELELPLILDMVSKSTDSVWKKVQFAKKTDDKVSLDQIKSSILALTAFPMLAVSVEDSAGKSASMFAKGVPSGNEAPAVKLPEGYTWVTAYVIYIPEKPVDKTAPADAKDPKAKVEQMTKEAFNKSVDMANMSSEERQKVFQNEIAGYMTLAPEARQMVLKDQMSTIFNMNTDVRQKYFEDMREAMKGMDWGAMRGGQPMGGGGGGGGRNRGQ